MKIVKRLLIGILTLTVFAMTACSKGTDTKETNSSIKQNAKVESLNVWLPSVAPNGNDAEIWDKIIKPFEEENKVDVKFQFISWKDYEAKYTSAIQTKTGPDVGYMYVEMFPAFIDAGAVENLDNYLTDEDYKTYTVLEDKYKIFGKHYGIALSSATHASGLFYNKDILDKMGEKVPENWDDVVRIAKKANIDTNGDGKIDQYGLTMGWGQTFSQDLNWNWYSFNWQAGGDIFDDNGKCIINNEAGLKAAQFLYDLKNTYKVLPPDAMSLKSTEAFDKYFAEGKSPLAFGWTNEASFKKLESASNKFNYGFTYKLKGPNGDQGCRSGVDQIVLMSAAKDKDLAWKLVKYMTGPVGGAEYHKIIKGGPTTKDEENNGLPQTKEALKEAGPIVHPIKAARRAPEVYDYLWKTLQDVMNNKVSPKEGMDQVAKFANDMPYSAPSK